MYCQLQSIINELERYFPVQTYGIISGPIARICRVPRISKEKLEPNVLYIATLGDLRILSDQKDLCQYPILCAVKQFDGRFTKMLLSMRSVILVKHEDTTDVLTALSEIMYNLGMNSNHMSDFYWNLMSASGLEELLGRASEQLNLPLLVTDSTHKIISHSGHETVAMGLQHLERIGCQLPNLQEAFQDGRCPVTAERNLLKFSFFKIDAGFYLLRIPLITRRELKGAVVVMTHSAELSEPLVEKCTTLVHFVFPYLQLEKQGLPVYSTMEKFLTMLLDSQLTDKTEIDRYLAVYQWRPKAYLYLSVFTSFGEPLKLSPQDLLQTLSELLHAKGFVYYSSIVLIHEASEELTSLELHQLLEPALSVIRQEHLLCGVSCKSAALTDLGKSFYLARKAIDLGQIFAPDDEIYFYEKYAVFHILEVASKSADLQAMLTAKLQQLEQSGAGDLLATLETYMKYGCNLTQCAKAMFLHVNTVKYRINQIMDVLQCDLRDGDTFCQVYMSLKIMEFTKKTKLPLA